MHAFGKRQSLWLLGLRRQSTWDSGWVLVRQRITLGSEALPPTLRTSELGLLQLVDVVA